MSAVALAGPAGGADPLLLRWSDHPDSPTREQPVEMVELHVSESIVRSSLQISERTQVYLIGKHYTGNGIIQCCRRDGNKFILTILMTAYPSLPQLSAELDPGVFAVDSFLTEEEELKILESLSNDAHRQSQALPEMGIVLRFLINTGTQMSLGFRRVWNNLIARKPIYDIT